MNQSARRTRFRLFAWGSSNRSGQAVLPSTGSLLMAGLQLVSNIVHIAERKRTEKERGLLNRSLRMLSHSKQLLIHLADEQGLLDSFCRGAVEVGGYRAAWVGRVDVEGVIEVGPAAHVRGERPLTSADCWIQDQDESSDDPVSVAIRSGKPALGFRSAACVGQGTRLVLYAMPLISHGNCYGILCLEVIEAETFTVQERHILNEMAGDIASGIHTLRERVVREQAEAALARSERNFRTIYENIPMAYQALDPTGRFKQANPALRSLLHIGDEQVAHGSFTDFLAEDSKLKFQDAFTRLRTDDEIHGIELVVLPYGGGRVEVAFDAKIGRDEAGDFDHAHCILYDITQRKAAEEEVRGLAFYDQLTRLPNRRLLLDRLQQAIAACKRSGRAGVLIFIDLDDFKAINDTFGHDHGDLLLKDVASRLKDCVRANDTIARLGGDEFVVLIDDLAHSPDEAASFAKVISEKILLTLNASFNISGHEHYGSASIGVALFNDSRNCVEELLRQADIAMYQAKSSGRNTFRFFDPEMQAAIAARVAMESDLRRAVDEGQLILYYQPQVDCDGRTIGAEALLRWQHPQNGLLTPNTFISIAEDTGLILPIGQWVLETACRQLVAWSEASNTAELIIAVNVSTRQFRQPDFVEQVCDTLRLTDANPNKLVLELTESLLLDDIENAAVKMTRLRKAGVRFSLDDFGTGYSSLAYLKQLPLDQVKIDRSFVHDILTDTKDAAIIRTVIALAQNLGLSVIAEGVESADQYRRLAQTGCNSYQGFLFGRPMPTEQFKNMPGLPIAATLITSARTKSAPDRKTRAEWPGLRSTG